MFNQVVARGRHRRVDVLMILWLAGAALLLLTALWGSAWGAATFLSAARQVANKPAIAADAGAERYAL